MLITILVFLVILTVLVLIHEWGHFFVARKIGIKVEEFGFGFPPRAFGIKKGETIYSINWLPIGGFVKLYGEDPAGGGAVGKGDYTKVKDIKRAYFARPWKERAAVGIAGVVMNSILAVLIFYLFLGISNFKTEISLLSDYKFFWLNQKTVSQVIISSVSKNSPAEKAGFKQFSEIRSINGQDVEDAKEFVDIVNKNRGRQVVVVWKDLKTNRTVESKVVPRVSPPKNEGALGIGFFTIKKAILSYDTFSQKIFSGVTHPLNLLFYELDVTGRLIGISIQKKTVEPIGSAVSGPVGIYSLVGDIVRIPDLKERILGVLNLAGLLSISLAFFNVLPIPALDGGRLFFILIEGVSGRKVNPKFEGYVHAIGMVILLTLLLLITFQDVSRVFGVGR